MSAKEQTIAELVKGARQKVNEFEQSGQDTDPIDDALDALTAQLQAAQAAIKAHNDGLISDCYDIDADTSTLAEHDKQVAAEALRDASWAHLMETGSPAEVRDMLRARAASIEQAEGE